MQRPNGVSRPESTRRDFTEQCKLQDAYDAQTLIWIKGRIAKAMYYTLGQWTKLNVFLTHGDVPMHDIRVGNAIRPFALGRKRWLFSDSVKGAIASANLYAFAETCKANGVEPHAQSDRPVRAAAAPQDRRKGRGCPSVECSGRHAPSLASSRRRPAPGC